MRRTVASERISKDAPALAASKKFGRYKKETERTVRKLDFKESKVFKQLKEAWLKSVETENMLRAKEIEEHDKEQWKLISEIVKQIQSYTNEDIQRFLITLRSFQDLDGVGYTAGAFLSNLLNQGQDNEYKLDLSYLDTLICQMCWHNTKNVLIQGDVGDSPGREMLSGSVCIKGNAQDVVALGMRGGILTIKGNVGNLLGLDMKGGTVIVEGNATNQVGRSMTGGRIIIKGNAEWFVGREMKGGHITIHGDVNCSLGYDLAGGEIIVEGNAQDIAFGMEAGKITVKGNVNRINPGFHGGEIHVEGDIGGIKASPFQRGKIYHKGKLIVDK